MSEINYHVWKVDAPEEIMDILGFVKKDGYYDKYIESQMDKHYIRIYRDIL